MIYTSTGSHPSSEANILPFMQEVDMFNATITSYSSEKIIRMVDDDLPVYISASNSQGDKAHAWVIDGICTQKKYTIIHNGDGTIQSKYEHKRNLYHCNFGYNGQCDGYYYFDILNPEKGFNLNTGPEFRDPRGDWRPNPDADLSNTNYNPNIKIITYSTW